MQQLEQDEVWLRLLSLIYYLLHKFSDGKIEVDQNELFRIAARNPVVDCNDKDKKIVFNSWLELTEQ